jgi:hypothetical protein
MKFPVPASSDHFEIPDEWWTFAEMTCFTPSPGSYYPYASGFSDVRLIELVSIEVPRRNDCVALFKKYKLLPILHAFHSPECALPPVQVSEIPESPGQFRLINGVHRYYASSAAGYSLIPSVVRMASLLARA